MPLIHSASNKAFKRNIKAEMHAGKPQKQSLAIAYSTQRAASGRKKMAKGGMAGPEQPSDIKCAHGGPAHCMEGCYAEGGMAERPGATATGEPGVPMRKSDDRRLAESDYMGKDWDGGPDYQHADTSMGPSKDQYDAEQWVAHGGMISDRAKSIAEAIMAKKKMTKMMAEGGEATLEDNEEEDASPLTTEEEGNADAAHEKIYDDDQLSEQPKDSNEDDEELDDEDKNDMVGSIRKKMKAKSRGIAGGVRG